MKYLLLFALSACAHQAPVAQAPQPKVIQHPIDMNKVKTVEDLKAIVSLLLPPEPIFFSREDSVSDEKKLASIKHLLKDEKKH